METVTEDIILTGYEHLTPDQRHRVQRADMIYEEAFGEVGLKTDSYWGLPGWVAFLEGEIDESELWEKVLAERENPPKSPRETV